MARYGKRPIQIPENVKITFTEELIKVEGPKGSLEIQMVPIVDYVIDNNMLSVVFDEKVKNNGYAMQGLAKSLINNMIIGVTKGFEKVLYLVGTIYSVQLKGKNLDFNLGYSHPVIYEPPEGISFEIETPNFSINSQKVTIIKVKGIDKQLVGQTAAKIRMLRKPDNYKGKGVRYKDEKLIIKEGKKAKK